MKTDWRALKQWPGRRGRKLKFVLLRHTHLSGMADHYDLMLELWPGVSRQERAMWGLVLHSGVFSGGDLKWRVHGMHRRRYLTFEGPINLANRERGIATRVESGSYVVRMRKGRLDITLQGKYLGGMFELLGTGDEMQLYWRRTSPRRVV